MLPIMLGKVRVSLMGANKNPKVLWIPLKQPTALPQTTAKQAVQQIRTDID